MDEGEDREGGRGREEASKDMHCTPALPGPPGDQPGAAERQQSASAGHGVRGPEAPSGTGRAGSTLEGARCLQQPKCHGRGGTAEQQGGERRTEGQANGADQGIATAIQELSGTCEGNGEASTAQN